MATTTDSLNVYDIYGKATPVAVINGIITPTLSGSPRYVVITD